MEGVVSYTQLKQWRFCRQAYYYRYVEGIFPKRKPRGLKIGGIIHDIIRAWALGQNYNAIVAAVKKEYKNMFDEEKAYYGDIPRIIESRIKQYVELYGGERSQYKFVEHSFGPIPLTNKTEFKFRIDRLLASKKLGLSLFETKTGKKIPEEDIRVWDLQTLLYVWGLWEYGEMVTSITWDYIRTKEPALPKILKDGSVSTRADIDTDYETFYQALIDNNCNPKEPEYRAILKSLKGDTRRFFKRVRLPINEKMIKPVVLDAARTSLEIQALVDKPIRSMSGFTCPRCQYQPLCYAVLNGLDEAFLREHEFVTKKKEEHAKEEEVDSED